jgi:histidinol-phosphate aminotransferase
VSDPLRHVHSWLRDAPVFAVGDPPVGMLRLDLNEGAYGPTPKALEALAAAAPDLNRYPDPIGGHGLRAALTERLDVDPATLLFGSGSNSLQSLLIRLVAGPGRRVVYSWPGFPTFGWAASRCGAIPVPVPTRADGTDDLDALAAAGRDAAVVVLATPNNPTGRVVTEGLEEFVTAVAPHALVLLDEAYHEYAPPRLTGLDLFHAGHEVVVLRTFSKAWGLAGARIGYAVLDPALQAVARSAQDTFEVSAATFMAARASLDDADVIAGRVAENARVRDRLEEHFAALGIDCWPSAANFVCARPPDPDAFAARLAEHGILVRPTAVFGAPERVRIGVPAESDADRVLAAITAALE